MPSSSRAASSLRTLRLLRSRKIGAALRPFSSSQSCSRYYPPAFEPTGSTELDELLETIRRKVFLPRHLKGETRNLVSDKTQSEQLKLEDIRVKVGDQEERLEPHDYSKDNVSWRKSHVRVLELTEEARDFSIWPQLIKGYRGAQLTMQMGQRLQLVRSMCTTGQLSALLDLLDSPNCAAFEAPPSSIETVLHSIRTDAIASDYKAFAADALSKVDVSIRDTFLQAVARGQSTDEFLSKIPDLSYARAQALRRGLRRAIRFNRTLAREHQQPLLELFYELNPRTTDSTIAEQDESPRVTARKTALSDPILITVPLEMQSRLETLLAVNPNAMQFPDSGAVEDKVNGMSELQTTTAADYAQRLLLSLEKQPILPFSKSQRSSLETTTRDARKKDLQWRRLWLSRALFVAASLRAAGQARTVTSDRTLRDNVKRQQFEIERLLSDDAKQKDELLNRWSRKTIDQYHRYMAGLEFGMYGQHQYELLTAVKD